MDEDRAIWSVDESRLVNLTPQGARDLLVECFLAAQGEVFRRTALTLDMMADTASMRAQVEASVKLKFRELGYDYDSPTRLAIQKVMDLLAAQATIWGTPSDVVEHHLSEMNRVLDRM